MNVCVGPFMEIKISLHGCLLIDYALRISVSIFVGWTFERVEIQERFHINKKMDRS